MPARVTAPPPTARGPAPYAAASAPTPPITGHTAAELTVLRRSSLLSSSGGARPGRHCALLPGPLSGGPTERRPAASDAARRVGRPCAALPGCCGRVADGWRRGGSDNSSGTVCVAPSGRPSRQQSAVRLIPGPETASVTAQSQQRRPPDRHRHSLPVTEAEDNTRRRRRNR